MEACPTCHRPFRRQKRFCYACDKPILKTHKWHVVGCFICHDDCSNPTLDLTTAAPLLANLPENPDATEEARPVH
jgi:hypothetical protein